MTSGRVDVYGEKIAPDFDIELHETGLGGDSVQLDDRRRGGGLAVLSARRAPPAGIGCATPGIFALKGGLFWPQACLLLRIWTKSPFSSMSMGHCSISRQRHAKSGYPTHCANLCRGYGSALGRRWRLSAVVPSRSSI